MPATLFTLVTLVILITHVTLAALVILVSLATLVILLTLVTLFRSSNQFYRAECITFCGFLDFIIHVQASPLFPYSLIRRDGWHCHIQVGPWQNQFF